jgi:hypothetical protein
MNVPVQRYWAASRKDQFLSELPEISGQAEPQGSDKFA